MYSAYFVNEIRRQLDYSIDRHLIKFGIVKNPIHFLSWFFGSVSVVRPVSPLYTRFGPYHSVSFPLVLALSRSPSTSLSHVAHCACAYVGVYVCMRFHTLDIDLWNRHSNSPRFVGVALSHTPFTKKRIVHRVCVCAKMVCHKSHWNTIKVNMCIDHTHTHIFNINAKFTWFTHGMQHGLAFNCISLRFVVCH